MFTYLQVITIPIRAPKTYVASSTCLFVITPAKRVALHKKQRQQKTKLPIRFRV